MRQSEGEEDSVREEKRQRGSAGNERAGKNCSVKARRRGKGDREEHAESSSNDTSSAGSYALEVRDTVPNRQRRTAASPTTGKYFTVKFST